MCIKAITVRFHLTHPAEKQAWEKLLSLRADRHQSFSQAVADAVNAYGAEETHLSRTEKDELVDEITESVASTLQHLPQLSIQQDTPVASAAACLPPTP